MPLSSASGPSFGPSKPAIILSASADRFAIVPESFGPNLAGASLRNMRPKRPCESGERVAFRPRGTIAWRLLIETPPEKSNETVRAQVSRPGVCSLGAITPATSEMDHNCPASKFSVGAAFPQATAAHREFLRGDDG